ncbi:MAG TPA: hemolysin III family protein [Acidimicrobiales bacterium]|nr:hemolysin III family protein [Acidimicrobiales bacterium]
MAASMASHPLRPRLRGVIHRYASMGFAVAFGALGVTSGDAAAAAWVSIYGLCVTAMLAVSAVYHSGKLSSPALRAFKRVDHSMILVAIAGSYTGIVGLALDGTTRVVLLAAVWSAAVVGVAIRMLWLDAPYPVTAAVYVAVGWVALLDVSAFVGSLTDIELALVVAGGVLYSLGAVVYALHRPNPWPTTFGYHEVFHAIVVLAATTHVVAVALLVARR